MQDYRTAVSVFIKGEMECSDLCAVLKGILEQKPERAGQILEFVQQQVKAGHPRQQIQKCISEYITDKTVMLPGVSDKTILLPLADTIVATQVQTVSSFSAQAGDSKSASQTADRNIYTGHEGSGTHVLEPGSVLKDRFVLENKIGSGGMGVVFKARDLRREEALDKEPHVAIKLLNNKYQDKPYAFIALQREAKKAQKLAHPNIINVYDFDRDGSLMMMTMEYLEGQSLQPLIRNFKDAPIETEQAFSFIRDICSALSYAHRNKIVHADIKPANIFLTNTNQVKLLDFGIARAVQEIMVDGDEETVFSPDLLSALTPAYASCEMLQGEKAQVSDDVYALACISYELLTGRHPYGRLKATSAETGGLRPLRPAGLKNRQWKGLQKGLAFRREHRTTEVAEFMREVLPERRNLSRTAKLALIGFTVTLPVLLGAYLYQLDQPGDLESLVAFEDLLPADQQKITDLLEIAEAHMSIQRLTAPPGSNAYAAYREVLQIHPDNSAARDGLKRIADRYLLMARERLENGDRAGAWQMLEAGLVVEPAHDGLLAMQKRIGK